jgi:hypothetical protein
LVIRHLQDSSQLFRNDGNGHFTEIDAGLFEKNDRHSCDWADVNNDGLDDMYCAIGVNWGRGMADNELWIQQPDETFVDEAEQYGVTDPYGRGRRVTFIDVNHDEFPDLYLTNAYPRQDEYESLNRLFINEGGTFLRDAPEYGLDMELSGQCLDRTDYNMDGWDDLFVCAKHGLRLFRNDQGQRFTDVTVSVGIARSAWEGYVKDMNGDGTPDLVRVDDASLSIQYQRGGLFGPPEKIFDVRQGVPAGNPVSPAAVAIGDANGDGRPDLYLVRGVDTVRDTNVADALFLNTGTSFTRASIPQTTAAGGNWATAVDFDGNGKDDFIVLNGVSGGTEWLSGPTQLIGVPN